MLTVFAAVALFAARAQAATYETAPPFCDGNEVVHDYLTPFRRMPRLHSPPVTGRVAFGPANLRFKPFPSLLVSPMTFGGYSLYLEGRRQAARLDWNATTTVWRIDWQGRPRKRILRARRHIGVVSRQHRESLRFRVGRRPAAYRLTAVFRNRAGRKLGGYGVYFRVVRPTRKTKLSLNADSYGPESTVFARVENYGTATVRYGAPYAIERLEGSTWIKAPESPSAFIMPLWGAGPGMTGVEGCSQFWVPPTMQPGRYRMTKEAEYAIRKSKQRRPTILSAEFGVTG